MKHALRQRFSEKYIVPFRVIKNYLTLGKNLTQSNLSGILRINFYFALILILIHFAFLVPVFRLAYEREWQSLLLGLLTLPFTTYLLCGLLNYYLALMRNQPHNVRLLFKGHARYFDFLFFNLCYYALYRLLFRMILEIGEYEGIFEIRIYFGIFAFIWILVRVLFAPIFMLEKNFNFRQSVKASFLLTGGRTTKTIIFFFVLLGVLFAGILVLFAGVLYTTSLVFIVYLSLYDVYSNNKFSQRKSLENQKVLKTAGKAGTIKAKPVQNL